MILNFARKAIGWTLIILSLIVLLCIGTIATGAVAYNTVQWLRGSSARI